MPVWSPRYVPELLLHEAATRLQDRFLFGSDYPVITPQRWLKDFDALDDFKQEVRQKMLWKNGHQLLAHTTVTHIHFSSSRDCLLALRQPCSTSHRETTSGMFAQPFHLGYTLSKPRNADGQYGTLKNTLTSCLERLLAEGYLCSRQQKPWRVLDDAAPAHPAHVQAEPLA